MHKLRWLKILIQFWLDRRPQDPFRPVETTFLITPFDVELTRAVSHVYFAFAGLGRWQISFYNIDWRSALREKWAPLTHSEVLQFRRALKLFTHVKVTTRVVWWDEKMAYFEHAFTQREKLCALGYSRGAFYKGRERIPSSRCIKNLPEQPPWEKPQLVTNWEEGGDLIELRPA